MKELSPCDAWPAVGGPRDGHVLLVPCAAPYVIALVDRLIPTRQRGDIGGFYVRDEALRQWTYVPRNPPATPEQEAYGRAAHAGRLGRKRVSDA